jgi:hypothetical protein
MPATNCVDNAQQKTNQVLYELGRRKTTTLHIIITVIIITKSRIEERLHSSKLPNFGLITRKPFLKQQS